MPRKNALAKTLVMAPITPHGRTSKSQAAYDAKGKELTVLEHRHYLAMLCVRVVQAHGHEAKLIETQLYVGRMKKLKNGTRTIKWEKLKAKPEDVMRWLGY